MKLFLFINAICLVSGVGRYQQVDGSGGISIAKPRIFELTISQDESVIDSLIKLKGLDFTLQTGEDEASVGDSSKIYFSDQVSLSYSKPENGDWRLLGLTATCDSCFVLRAGEQIIVGQSIVDVAKEYPELVAEIQPEVVADSVRLSRVGSLSLAFKRSVDHVSIYPYGLVHIYFEAGRVSRFAVQHQLE